MKKNKRLLSLILAIFMLLTAPAYTYVPVEATTIAAINTNTKVSYKCKLTVKAKTQNTVWLSATGNKYHKIPNCGRMNPNRARKVDLSYAKAHRYTPCSKCF